MEPRRRSADEMIRLVAEDPSRLDKLKTDPLPELEKLKDEAVRNVPMVYIGDPLVYRMVISVLGLIVLVAAVGALYLQINAKDIPQSVVGLGSTALGALAGLLAPSPASR